MNKTVLPLPQPSKRLDGLPGYGRGRAGQAQTFYHRLGSNEAPDSPAPEILAAAVAALETGNRYPDLRGETLADALAARYGLHSDNIAVSAGSIILLDQIVRGWCDPGDEIVVPWRSYEAYPIIAGLSGARLIEVALDANYRINKAAILDAISPRCRIIILCNPNNPTGTALPDAEINELLEALPSNVLVVLDEAYIEYAQTMQEMVNSPAIRLARYPNLIILRTFSKAWGLAGFRAGYCLASSQIITTLHAVAPPFPLPVPILAAALAALDRTPAVEARVALNEVQRERMSKGLLALNLPVAQSQSNFLWLPVGEAASDLANHFQQEGIAVRCFAGEGVRITIGTESDTVAVLNAAASWHGLKK